jgi:hypothetical protein
MHPLDEIKEKLKLLLIETHDLCDVHKTCDIVLFTYTIPSPLRCGDCTEELRNAVRKIQTWRSSDEDQIMPG